MGIGCIMDDGFDPLIFMIINFDSYKLIFRFYFDMLSGTIGKKGLRVFLLQFNFQCGENRLFDG